MDELLRYKEMVSMFDVAGGRGAHWSMVVVLPNGAVKTNRTKTGNKSLSMPDWWCMVVFM